MGPIVLISSKAVMSRFVASLGMGMLLLYSVIAACYGMNGMDSIACMIVS